VAGVEGTPAEGIEISASHDAAGNVVIAVSGDLDLLAADSLRQAVAGALGGTRKKVIFELGALRFIDSAGLAVLIEASTSADSVELRSLSPAVRRTVELTGLTDVLNVVP
jgi:anti-sigma B factor antagonist